MPKTGKPKRNAVQRGQCRIIAGKWRGRIIRFDDAEGLRPTTDRIRETVFNWLQPYLPKSRCLDCFAGSGVLGFEALSRGADQVVFIEQNKTTLENLKTNSQMLDAADAVFLHADTLAWLQRKQEEIQLDKSTDQTFDLIFLDPPFHSELLEKSSSLLDNSGCLAEDAIIYVEHAVDDNVVLPENWSCLKEKRSGQVAYKLFEKCA